MKRLKWDVVSGTNVMRVTSHQSWDVVTASGVGEMIIEGHEVQVSIYEVETKN